MLKQFPCDLLLAIVAKTLTFTLYVVCSLYESILINSNIGTYDGSHLSILDG